MACSLYKLVDYQWFLALAVLGSNLFVALTYSCHSCAPLGDIYARRCSLYVYREHSLALVAMLSVYVRAQLYLGATMDIMAQDLFRHGLK